MYDINIFENQFPMPGIEPSTTYTQCVVSDHANHYTTDARMRSYFNLINGIILNVWRFFWKSTSHHEDRTPNLGSSSQETCLYSIARLSKVFGYILGIFSKFKKMQFYGSFSMCVQCDHAFIYSEK